MDAFSVRTKIMIGGGMDALAQRLHRVFLVTDKFMAESGKTNYVTDRLLRSGGDPTKVQTPAEARAALQAVTRDDVRAILRKLTLSVSYLLTKEVAAHAAE